MNDLQTPFPETVAGCATHQHHAAIMNFRYILRIFTLLFLFHSVILVEAAHAQRWNVFGRVRALFIAQG